MGTRPTPVIAIHGQPGLCPAQEGLVVTWLSRPLDPGSMPHTLLLRKTGLRNITPAFASPNWPPPLADHSRTYDTAFPEPGSAYVPSTLC